VNFIGWFDTPMHVYIAMDFHELGSLDRQLAPTLAPLPESEVKGIMDQVLKALDFMHGLHFMHRDLKPAVRASSPKLQVSYHLTRSRTECSGSQHRPSVVGKTRRLWFQQKSYQQSRSRTHRRRHSSVHGSGDARHHPRQHLHKE
jgi:hypothetical protein